LNEEVDGVTVRQHLQAVWEKTGVMPARLAALPPCPPALEHVWRMFLRLRRRCTPSMGRPRILFTDMAAFQAVTGERIAPWEAALIERLDDALMEASNGR